MKKLAVLDKDGTLVLPLSSNTFVQNPTDQILMTGAIEGCERLIADGFTLAIASNQGGVYAGHKTLDEAISEMRYCLHLLNGFDIPISLALLCPDFYGVDCYNVTLESSESVAVVYADLDKDLTGTYRKPRSGMLNFAGYGNPEDSWMIGDRDEDKQAAIAAGFSFLDADVWRKGASPWIV